MPDQDFSADLAIFRDRTESFFRRADAVRRLARSGDAEAHRVAVEALQDEESYVRRAAAEGLVNSAQPADLDAVLAAFDADKDDQVKRVLLKTLGAFADERALAKVKETVDSGSYSLRYDAQSVVSTIERKLAEKAEAGKARAQEAPSPPSAAPSAEEITPLRAPALEAETVVPLAPPVPAPPVAPPGPPEPREPEPPEDEASPPEPGEAAPPPTPESEPEEPTEPEKPREPSAGVLDFRSWSLAESLFWVPAALWPVLALLGWMDGHRASGWLGTLVVLVLVFWRRGVQCDGFTRIVYSWSGVFVPLRKRFHEYQDLTGIEVREHASHWAEILPEGCRAYMRLELGRYDVMLLREKGSPIRLKRFRNSSAAMVAARQAADFLALDLNVQQGKQ
jgi:hypothetical protein